MFTFAESPRRRGVMWAGSDDGLIHVSLNGGSTWQNVTPKGMPKWGLVSMIEASPHDPAVAFAAVDNHENDDLTPYVYRTSDYGKTWTSITGGLPRNSYVRVVREDVRRKGLLYAGTETGIWVSFDNGSAWQSLRLNMPVTPIHDIAWKDDDLVLATHGRGFWVMDDLSPLQQLMPGTPAAAPKLFAPRDTYRVRWGGGGGRRGGGASGPTGENAPSGVQLNYFLPAETSGLKFELRDGKGRLFQTVGPVTGRKGFNRSSVWLQEPSWQSAPGMILWSGFPSPITLPPGEYTVTMVAGDVRQQAKFRWLKDPRTPSSDRDLVAQHAFLKEVSSRLDAANGAVQRIRKVRTALEEAQKGAKLESISRLIAGITSVEEAIYQTKNRSGQDPLNYPIRLNDKLAGVFSTANGGEFPPTTQAREVFRRLSAELSVQEGLLKRHLEQDLAAVNRELAAKGLPEVKVSG